MERQLYLVRHGDTPWTREARFQGQTDVPLSSEGHRQAREVARYLARVEFDAAYASDLSRALDTARAILRAQSGPVTLVSDPDLREISDGTYEGWSVAAAAEAEPRIAERLDGRVPAPDFAPPGGESIRQVFIRQRDVASRLVDGDIGRRILIVGHGWALRVFAAALSDRGPEGFWELASLRPASVSIIELGEGTAAITSWNHTGHLSE